MFEIKSAKLAPIVSDDTFEPQYDLSTKEQILLHVSPGGYTFGLDVCQVFTPEGRNPGFASCEQDAGGALDYMLSLMLEADILAKEGYYVVEGATGIYTRGDGWEIDDDSDLDFESVRPATQEEIDQA